jgi:hypothetical protein
MGKRREVGKLFVITCTFPTIQTSACM